MAEGFGDVVKLPGITAVAEVKPSDIVASYTPPPLIKGGTVKSGQGQIAAGTVMGYETASKKYVVYNNAGSGGAEVAKAVLLEAVDTTGGDRLGNLVFAGVLKLDKLTGLDSAAIADFNGRTDTERNLFIF